MKEADMKVLSELMKNSKLSDRELANRIGRSQPTATRARKRLEKEGYINHYTLIPDFSQVGYHLLALTFAKIRSYANSDDIRKIARKAREEFRETAPMEIIFSGRGIGLGFQGVFISLHRDIKSYLEFRDWLVRYSANAFSFIDISTIEGFLISLDEDVHYRKLTFSTLAEHMFKSNKKKE